MALYPGQNHIPERTYSISQIKGILTRLDKIDGLTDNIHILELTKQIRSIL